MKSRYTEAMVYDKSMTLEPREEPVKVEDSGYDLGKIAPYGLGELAGSYADSCMQMAKLMGMELFSELIPQSLYGATVAGRLNYTSKDTSPYDDNSKMTMK